MSFKNLLTEIRIKAFEQYADEYFRILALNSGTDCTEIAPAFAIALNYTPYSVEIMESGALAFRHLPTGHLVTAAASSVRREFVAAVPPMREFGFTRSRSL